MFTPVEQAVLSFTLDLNYLSEHCQHLRGRSKVRELALKVLTPFKRGNSASGEEEKAIGNLVSLTSRLESFELHPFNFEPSLAWLGALGSSSNTLKTLRIISDLPLPPRTSGLEFFLFNKLIRLSISNVYLLSMTQDKNLNLPESLEVIELPFYTFKDFRNEGTQQICEDSSLAHILCRQSLPNLQEVNVPSGPFDSRMNETKSEIRRNSWKENRRILESCIKTLRKNVKLTVSEPGGKGEFCLPSRSLLYALKGHVLFFCFCLKF